MTTETLAQETDFVTRYIFDKHLYNSTQAKPNAFIDSRIPGELSVFRINDLEDSAIWELSTAVRADRRVKARADLSVKDVHAIKVSNSGFLRVFIDGVPHPRHANIKNLPSDISFQRAIAAELSDKSMLKQPDQ